MAAGVEEAGRADGRYSKRFSFDVGVGVTAVVVKEVEVTFGSEAEVSISGLTGGV